MWTAIILCVVATVALIGGIVFAIELIIGRYERWEEADDIDRRHQR